MAELSAVLQKPETGLDRIGRALADPIRQSILIELLTGPACPSDLADRLETTRPNLSNHLSCLRGCGLVVAERAGRNLNYRLVSDEFATVLQALLDLSSNIESCEAQLA